MDFSRFLPITKVDDEQRMVWGYASTGALDLDGEIIKVSAIKAALPDYLEWGNIREMHTASAVGVAAETAMDDKGLWLGAHISDDTAWRKCKPTTLADGTVLGPVYKGFSIGGAVRRKVGMTIEELQLIEISLVDRPANPECRIEMVKGAQVLETGEATLVRIAKADLGDLTVAEVPDVGRFQSALRKLGMRLGVTKDFMVRPQLEGTTVAPCPLDTETDPADEPEEGTRPRKTDRDGPSDGLSGPTKSADDADLAKSLWTLSSVLDAAMNLSGTAYELDYESRAEGDGGDTAMADTAQDIAARLLGLVSVMAAHEAGEMATRGKAADMTQMTAEQIAKAKKDKDNFEEAKDRLTNAKKRVGDAQMCRSAAAKAAGSLAALLADQVTKSAEADAAKAAPPVLDVKKAAELITSIAKALGEQMDHLDMADLNITKAAGNVFSGDAGPWTSGVVSTAPGMPMAGLEISATGPTPGKAAEGTVTKAEADLMAKLAAAEAITEVYKNMPAGGRRATTFDARTLSESIGGDASSDDMAKLMKGVTWNPEDPDSRANAAGKVIGNMIANAGRFGKRLNSPDFHGAAG